MTRKYFLFGFFDRFFFFLEAFLKYSEHPLSELSLKPHKWYFHEPSEVGKPQHFQLEKFRSPILNKTSGRICVFPGNQVSLRTTGNRESPGFYLLSNYYVPCAKNQREWLKPTAWRPLYLHVTKEGSVTKLTLSDKSRQDYFPFPQHSHILKSLIVQVQMR